MPSFFTEYVKQALRSSDAGNGKSLADHYTPANINAYLMARMREDCERFCQENARELIAYCNFEQAGREFWLSRNGLSGGFLAGDYPEEIRERLWSASTKFGDLHLFINGAGQIDGV